MLRPLRLRVIIGDYYFREFGPFCGWFILFILLILFILFMIELGLGDPVTNRVQFNKADALSLLGLG